MNFEDAVMPHLDAAYNLARWLTRNEDDAQDMVQEAYLRALRFFGGFHGTDARAWLLTIVRNTCYTWLKRNRSPELMYDFDEVVETKQSDEPDPEVSHVRKVQAQLVNEAIEQLPFEFREVVILRDVDQKRCKASIDTKRRVVMKRVVVKGFASAGLLVVMTIIAASASVKAQSLQYRLTADIPFDFSVAGKKLPAGKYWVNRAQESSGDLIVQIRSTDGHSSISRLTIPVFAVNPMSKGSLVFHRYGDEYFLSEIWPAGGQTGRELPKSRVERELARKAQDSGIAAATAPKLETVTLRASN